MDDQNGQEFDPTQRTTVGSRTIPSADEVLRGDRSPLFLVGLLEGRTNEDRAAALAWYLRQRAGANGFTRQTGRGRNGMMENFWVDIGRADKTLMFIAHHDAVSESPGANDNAAAVGILLHLMEHVEIPTRLRVRLLFTAEEEAGLLGARLYAGTEDLQHLAGVISLELCGIGDHLVLWDVDGNTPFLLKSLGATGALPFGRVLEHASDHRVFAEKGIPAYGLTILPHQHLTAIATAVSSYERVSYAELPAPFNTYHTSRDDSTTLEAAAMEKAERALQKIIWATVD